MVAHCSSSPLRHRAAKEEEGPASGHQSWCQEIQGVQVLDEEEGQQQAWTQDEAMRCRVVDVHGLSLSPVALTIISSFLLFCFF